jgi:hypothetical protein
VSQELGIMDVDYNEKTHQTLEKPNDEVLVSNNFLDPDNQIKKYISNNSLRNVKSANNFKSSELFNAINFDVDFLMEKDVNERSGKKENQGPDLNMPMIIVGQESETGSVSVDTKQLLKDSEFSDIQTTPQIKVKMTASQGFGESGLFDVSK